MKKEQGHAGGAMVLADQETPISLLRDIKRLLSLQQATDMPADGEEYRDYAIVAGAGDLYIDTDVQFGYAYIPNCPRDITIYSGTRGGLIGSFNAGAFVQFRMPRSTGVTITYGAGSAAQALTVYLSAREVTVSPGSFLVDPGTAAGSLGKIEDTPHATGDVGVQILGVANQAQSTLSADGDYTPVGVTTKGSVIIAPLAADVVVDSSAITFARMVDVAGASRGAVVMGMLFNGLTYDRSRTPNVFKTFSLAASSAEQTIWTPTAGKKFRLMGFVLTINTLAATVTFRDNTAGATIFVTAGLAGAIVAPSNLGNGILSATINNLLTIQASAVSALVGTVWGTEE